MSVFVVAVREPDGRLYLAKDSATGTAKQFPTREAAEASTAKATPETLSEAVCQVVEITI